MAYNLTDGINMSLFTIFKKVEQETKDIDQTAAPAKVYGTVYDIVNDFSLPVLINACDQTKLQDMIVSCIAKTCVSMLEEQRNVDKESSKQESIYGDDIFNFIYSNNKDHRSMIESLSQQEIEQAIGITDTESESKSEAKSEVKVEAKVEPVVKVEPEVKAVIKPEVKVESEAKVEVTPEVKVEVTPEVKVESEAKVEVTPEVKVKASPSKKQWSYVVGEGDWVEPKKKISKKQPVHQEEGAKVEKYKTSALWLFFRDELKDFREEDDSFLWGAKELHDTSGEVYEVPLHWFIPFDLVNKFGHWVWQTNQTSLYVHVLNENHTWTHYRRPYRDSKGPKGLILVDSAEIKQSLLRQFN